MDVAAMYADARERVASLVTEAGDEAMERPVPGTPDWTGRQLLSHMVGVPVDVLAGRFEGAGGDEWTAAQVASREGRSVGELVEEWRSTAEGWGDVVRGIPEKMAGSLATDLLQHELDLRGMLGAPVPESLEAAIEPSLNFMVGFLDRRVKKAGLPALQLRAGNQEWTLGPGESTPAATLSTTTLELFRVLAGRRSAAQVRALEWNGDPEPYLPVFSAFGSLAANDVEEAFGAAA